MTEICHCGQPATDTEFAPNMGDYCEQHAHEAAQRMRETFKVVVEPT